MRHIEMSSLAKGVHDAVTFHWPGAADAKAGLMEAIEARRAATPGIRRTNTGDGWHSDVDLAGWTHPAIAALMRFIAESADTATAHVNGVDTDWRNQPWRAQAWANVNPPGGAANALHDHVQMNWHWSGCYYVQCDGIAAAGQDNGREQGRIVFEHRWHGLRLAKGSRLDERHVGYSPCEGELILFPSWQHHRVEPHHGDRDRVSIAFNLHTPQLERSRYWTYRPGPLDRRAPAVAGLLRKLTGRTAHDATGRPPGHDLD